MMAIIGMFFQDGLTGSAWGDWSLYQDSPLRSGIKSPGWNPLPDFDVPPNGFEGNVGDQPPLGFWDPLGYTADGDFNKFQRRREVEIKHGRVSMLACIGYIVPEYFRWPGMLSPSEGISFTDVPNGLGALSKVPVAGWAQIFAFAGAVELGLFKPTGEPGNYGQGFLGALGILGSIQETSLRKKKLGAEISNGRLAMFAIIGMFFQDGLTGSAWGDWALFEASPLRAFESELGVQPPVGFWDPLGFTRNGDELAYKRRRVTELKHGRVCMLATLGYIVPETLGKFRGELSPSLGLKFSDIPNGLAAISKVPAIGWVQIIAFAGCVEGAWSFNEDYSGTPGDYGWKAITSVDEEIRTRKLSAELANGRLAMMAIIGMFFQDGLTGQAWGDWSLYTDSPLRDGMTPSTWAAGAMVSTGSGAASAAPIVIPDREVGAMAPLGYWDPAGLSKNISDEEFRKFRTAELKHGRIAMLANLGLLVQAMGARFDGFEKVPAGIEACTTNPGAGGLGVLVLAAGFFELKFLSDEGKEPGNFGDPLRINAAGNGEYNGQWRNMELNNGRLAMIGVIGSITAEYVSGLDAMAQWRDARQVSLETIKKTIWWAP